jgi:hypothetical protein
VRVIAVPPAVDDPEPHVAQLLAPLALNLESPPHGVCVLPPSHEWPASHLAHEVRLVDVPPAVKFPEPHVAQLLAPLALNLESPPHGVCVLPPSHEWPAAHLTHEVCVPDVPPTVNEPGPQ